MDPQALADMEKLARAKAIIRRLESSNGQNMKHAMLEDGPNKGQTAGGAYGIVPGSLIDFAKQSMKRNIPVDTDILTKMDEPHEQVTQELNSNREFDEKAGEMAMNLILQKAGGDEEKAAYAWRTGHNRSNKDMTENAPAHPYVHAYRKEKENYKPDRKIASVESSKPLDESSKPLAELSDPTFAGKIRAMLGL